MKPLLSVCLITYNHANYIAQAIEGVLMQEVNFSWELIIADDCSTDVTRDIILAYQKKYPEFIKLILQEKNVGAAQNWIELINYPQSKYIAYFEGDDHWVDSNKLQKQVDFLEANPNYAISFHRVYEIADGNEPLLSNLNTSFNEETYTIEDLAKGNFIHTPSVIFRNKLFKDLPAWFPDSPVGDYPLYMLNARYGNIKYFPEPMAVYRRHPGSIWSGKSQLYQSERWNIMLGYLVKEFKNTKVAKILLDQKANNEYIIASKYKESGKDAEYRVWLKKAFASSSDFFLKWAIQHGQKNKYLARYWRIKIYKKLTNR